MDNVMRPIIQPRCVILIRPDYQFAKRLMDVIICVIVLPFALVLMALCAVLVWMDEPGPILFLQYRIGWGGKRFCVYKFRTMVKNAENLKQQYAHLNEKTWPDFKISKDPRVTRIGRWLRKTSLDELPQLFNVLKGDMSLVGPRPASFDKSAYDLWQTERLEVLPGITGLAQINGRNTLDTVEKMRFDLEYVQNRSVWLDLHILLRTPKVILSQTGAY